MRQHRSAEDPDGPPRGGVCGVPGTALHAPRVPTCPVPRVRRSRPGVKKAARGHTAGQGRAGPEPKESAQLPACPKDGTEAHTKAMIQKLAFDRAHHESVATLTVCG